MSGCSGTFAVLSTPAPRSRFAGAGFLCLKLLLRPPGQIQLPRLACAKGLPLIKATGLAGQWFRLWRNGTARIENSRRATAGRCQPKGLTDEVGTLRVPSFCICSGTVHPPFGWNLQQQSKIRAAFRRPWFFITLFVHPSRWFFLRASQETHSHFHQTARYPRAGPPPVRRGR